MSENKTSSTINESNSNQSVANGSVITLKVYEHREIPPKLAVYLPENLNLDKIIVENPPKDFPPFQKQRNNLSFQKDKLMFILHLITYLPSVIKDFDYEANVGFVPLNKEKLQKSAIHDYRPHLDYLIHCGIIIEDSQYIVGQKSKGVKFTSEFNFQKIKRRHITRKPIIKAVIENSTQNFIECMEQYHYLGKWWNTQKLEIDYNTAKTFLKAEQERKVALFEDKYGKSEAEVFDCRLSLPKREKRDKVKYPTKQYNAALMLVDKLEKYEYLTKIDKTSGRFHTLLTQLPKELRQFVTYDGKELVGVDLVNSQPLLANALLSKSVFESNPILFHTIAQCKPYLQHLPSASTAFANLIGKKQNKADVLKYREVTSNGLYDEEFGKILQAKNLVPSDVEDVRGFAKTATFSSFFAKNTNARISEPMQHFKTTFPNVYDVFSKIKFTPKGTKKTEKLHNALSVSLQALEAELFLNRICRKINEINPEIVIFTIHDSVVTTPEYVEIVQQVIDEEIYNAIGIKPKMGIEHWQGVKGV